MLGVLGACCKLPRTDVMLTVLIVLLPVGCVLGIFVASIGKAPVRGLLLALKLVPFVVALPGRLLALVAVLLIVLPWLAFGMVVMI